MTVSIDDVQAELEEDLAWRSDEIRHLRNGLLSDIPRDRWPAAAMRALLVMQYAHLEGFARNAFAIYLASVNSQGLLAEELHPSIFATAMTEEFDAVRRGVPSEQHDEEGRLTRRAKNQVAFVEKLYSLRNEPIVINVDAAVSMEMNFGSDVLRRTLFRLGMPENCIDRRYFSSLEFVRKLRNDIAHGSRKERIQAGEFEAHQRKCEEFMSELVRTVTKAVRLNWFLRNVDG